MLFSPVKRNRAVARDVCARRLQFWRNRVERAEKLSPRERKFAEECVRHYEEWLRALSR
jgi:hypothetical protein